MTEPPLIEMRGLSKQYGGAVPLRVRHFSARASDRLVIGGLDAAAAEMLTHLICGAVLPEEGEVRIGGVPTREIATDTAWLGSLDRFGLVSHRAVLVDGMSIRANMALPLTLSVEPLEAAVRDAIESMARDVGLAHERLAAPAGTLTPAERVRVHLARALIARPDLVLLEHPTAPLEAGSERAAFGRALRSAAETRGVGWVAMSDDDEFAAAAGGSRLEWQRGTGELRPRRAWRFWGR
jgi:ABC-type lipoprotein export system ATPase subunit